MKIVKGEWSYQGETLAETAKEEVEIALFNISSPSDLQCENWARYSDFYSVYRAQVELGGYLVTIVILVQFYPIFVKKTLF